MEKINVAELLKDCPKGMELYSPLCGDCKLYDVNDYNIRIETPNKDTLISLYHDGRYCINGEIMLFPKGKTTWEGFQRPFKDGDIVFSGFNLISIFKGIEEKQKLFQAIKDNGYKWNDETKTLEKLIQPKFKVGNKITNGKTSIIIGYIDDEYYYEIGRSIATRLLIKNQDEWELVSDKFDITNLVPFESRVLIRNNSFNKWNPAIWGFYDSDSKDYQYKLVGVIARYCIPYEGNEHLLGTTNDCDEYFKTWE